jgi:hypothetical protein
MIGWIDSKGDRKALHMVVAEDINTNKCLVVTAYWPDKNKWNSDFKTKRINI